MNFAKKYPKLAKEWDYKKNNLLGIYINDASYGSGKMVWWICDKGHSYQAEIRSRVKGNNCPICSGHIVLAGFNDLATTHPDLVKEWDYSKNIDVSPESVSKGSRTKVWWKCEYGHSWEAAIYHRTKDRGCPICNSSRQTSFPEQAIYFYLTKKFDKVINRYKEIFDNKMEIDIYIKDINVGIEYDGRIYHNSKKSVDREKLKHNICKKKNIKLIRINENGLSKSDSCDKEIICKWNSDNYNDLDKAIKELFDYLKITYNEIDSQRDRINILNLYKKEITNKSLQINNDRLSKEWDYEKNGNLKPEMFNLHSGIKVWWKCSKGHSWQATIAKRSNGNNCPICSNHMVLRGYNDLATTHPKLLSEWNYKKNIDISPYDVTAGSHKKVWWKCEKGHEWEVAIYKRSIGHKCPFCSNKLVLKGYNDLATTNPELLKIWDFGKNKDISPFSITAGSARSAWWKCENGHSWYRIVRNQIKIGQCPNCKKRDNNN